jgi:hypothetical protein
MVVNKLIPEISFFCRIRTPAPATHANGIVTDCSSLGVENANPTVAPLTGRERIATSRTLDDSITRGLRSSPGPLFAILRIQGLRTPNLEKVPPPAGLPVSDGTRGRS